MASAVFRVLVITSVLVLALSPAADAQTLWGYDGVAGAAVQFDMGPGLACPPAAPLVGGYPVAGIASVCAAAPVIVPAGGPTITVVGDIAVDRITDITYVTDGMTIFEFVNGSATFGPLPGFPVNNYAVPIIPTIAGIMGPLTGMGMDPLGAVTGGIPTLWVTDGIFIAGLGATPPGSCLVPVVVVPSFGHGIAGVFAGDVTWDPFTGTFWICDLAGGGLLSNVLVGGGLGPGGAIPLAPIPWHGVAYDLASPGVAGFGTNQPSPSVFVTDGFAVGYVDVGVPGLAVPTFYASTPAGFPTPAPINGLAWSTHAVKWGAPPGATAIESVGQSSAPGPSFGLGMTGGTAGSNVWVFFGINAPAVPSGGFFCPALPIFTPPPRLYADIFSPPGGFIFLGLMPVGGVFFLPSPIGAAPPPGVEVFVQFLEDFSNVGTGPFTLTDPLLITISAP